MNMREEVEKTLLEFCENEHKFLEDGVEAIMRIVELDERKLAEIIYDGFPVGEESMKKITRNLSLAWREMRLTKPQKTYGAAGMSEGAVDDMVEKVREANTPDKKE